MVSFIFGRTHDNHMQVDFVDFFRLFILPSFIIIMFVPHIIVVKDIIATDMLFGLY